MKLQCDTIRGNGNCEISSSPSLGLALTIEGRGDSRTAKPECPPSAPAGERASTRFGRKAFVYKLKLNKKQLAQLEATLETCRRLYNHCLWERRECWEQHPDEDNQLRHVTLSMQKKAHVTERRKSDAYLSAVNSQILQDVLSRLDKTFLSFFKRLKNGQTPGYPRFKGRGQYNSFTDPFFAHQAKQVTGRKIWCAGVGLLKMFYDRPIQGKAKIATFIRRADGWFVSIVCEVELETLPATGESVGIDLGIEAFATLSTGERIENLRHIKKHQTKLKRASRRLSRRSGPDKKNGKRPSNRWKKARALLKKAHQRVSNARKEFHRRTVSSLITRFDAVAVEDLNIAGMMKNHSLAKAISDVGWGYFVSMLETKAESAGRTVTKVAPQYTSQDCSECGQRVPKKLSQRWHTCPYCGLQLHRDTNAARNILARAT